ncbi:MAG: DNA recombination protein RmuC, partial [Planctomycetes bacterium]|nr:DNA recombination protein RmuC [Planctomycetota bacterium]
RCVHTHLASLSRKAYFEQFESAPEFVVLFLPGEAFFSAALQHDPSLIEAGAEQKVILASPTTLIALLLAVAHGWRQERLADNARQISGLGRELYERLAVLGGYFGELGKRLNGAVSAYNNAVSSLESRVLISARKFRQLGISGKDIPLLQSIEQNARQPQAPELQGRMELD